MLAARMIRTVGTVAIALMAGCSGVNVQNEVYQTLDEARAAGAIDRGWIPQGLPPSTTDLRVAHLGDGRRWGVFSFDAAHAPTLKALVGDEITSGPVQCDAPGRVEWWPRILRSPIDLDHVRSTGLRLHRTRDGRLTFAVNWSLGRAYYWVG
jgi:hypothetical protein